MKSMPSKIIMATRNKGKVAELRKLLEEIPVEILTLADFPELPEVNEDGLTFQDNAVKKAEMTAEATGLIAIADDSGLEVEYLKGQPGVRSARFAGEPPDDARNNEKLLACLRGVPPEQRKARFVSVIAIAVPGGETYTARGTCEGIILDELRGNGGFGYDPLFYVPVLKKTFAELSTEEKNRISHRGEALRKAGAILRRLFMNQGV